MRWAAILLVAHGTAFAQDPTLRFRWAVGDTLDHRVTQTTTVTETAPDEKGKLETTDTQTTLELVKRWTVREVDAAGAGTLELTVTRAKHRVGKPDGTALTVMDSDNPDDAKQMAKYLNTPILIVVVDPTGAVLDVKESQPGSAARVRTELPFRVILPPTAVPTGGTWGRAFVLTLDPPHGTGEKYDAAHTFTAKGAANGLAVIGVVTTLKTAPATAAERVPLVPLLWAGDVYVNVATGRFHAARLTAKGEVADHQGPGSKFVYSSSYAEDVVAK